MSNYFDHLSTVNYTLAHTFAMLTDFQNSFIVRLISKFVIESSLKINHTLNMSLRYLMIYLAHKYLLTVIIGMFLRHLVYDLGVLVV